MASFIDPEQASRDLRQQQLRDLRAQLEQTRNRGGRIRIRAAMWSLRLRIRLGRSTTANW